MFVRGRGAGEHAEYWYSTCETIHLTRKASDYLNIEYSSSIHLSRRSYVMSILDSQKEFEASSPNYFVYSICKLNQLDPPPKPGRHRTL